jgi:small subunit ribosomal protein S8
MHTHPISEMLTHMRNAIMRKKSFVFTKFSKQNWKICEFFKNNGYIYDFKKEKRVKNKFPEIKIVFRFFKKQNVINNLKVISKPGVPVYKKAKKIHKVFDGLGLSIVSTSKGLLSNEEAKERNLGGKILLSIW